MECFASETHVAHRPVKKEDYKKHTLERGDGIGHWTRDDELLRAPIFRTSLVQKWCDLSRTIDP
ncbi:MAG: hypothetical protein F6J93_32760 [Oscillatoria sp. SIO1A7]|nr:hypothetical protein [Oscillatoria sp. SIO1A7]